MASGWLFVAESLCEYVFSRVTGVTHVTARRGAACGGNTRFSASVTVVTFFRSNRLIRSSSAMSTPTGWRASTTSGSRPNRRRNSARSSIRHRTSAIPSSARPCSDAAARPAMTRSPGAMRAAPRRGESTSSRTARSRASAATPAARSAGSTRPGDLSRPRRSAWSPPAALRWS